MDGGSRDREDPEYGEPPVEDDENQDENQSRSSSEAPPEDDQEAAPATASSGVAEAVRPRQPLPARVPAPRTGRLHAFDQWGPHKIVKYQHASGEGYTITCGNEHHTIPARDSGSGARNRCKLCRRGLSVKKTGGWDAAWNVLCHWAVLGQFLAQEGKDPETLQEEHRGLWDGVWRAHVDGETPSMEQLESMLEHL